MLYRRIQSPRVPQPNGAFKLERYSAAEEFSGMPDDEVVDEAVPTLDHYSPDSLPVNYG